jgi:hypothetical protein
MTVNSCVKDSLCPSVNHSAWLDTTTPFAYHLGLSLL